MAASLPLMIAADLKAAGRMDVTSPYDGRVLATVDTGGGEHVEHALAIAHERFRDRASWPSIPQRVAWLERVAELMLASKDELARLAASEGGKPLRDSQVEVRRAIEGVKLCVEALRGHAGTVIPLGTTDMSAGRTAHTQKEPIGVVVAVSAFNHPLNLIVHQVAPAVATGCPVIVKPAGDTPLSCLKFVELLWQAGVPREWCQAIVTDTNETAEALVTDRRVGFFSFIGSAKIGWMLRNKLAPGTRCALEHGGAAPAFLVDPFDQALAVESIAKGGFYHAGQVCVSVQRVYAPADKAAAFADALAARAARLTVGDPELETTDVGPLIRAAEVERVASWVEEAVDAGAKLVCGGKKLANNSYAPTVLLDPPRDAKVSTQEIFGPVVCVYSCKSIDAALREANALPVAFQAAVYSQDIDSAMTVYRGVDASAVMVNDHTAFRDDVMPFAGLRESGLGVGGIPYTMEDMQVDKLLVLRSPAG